MSTDSVVLSKSRLNVGVVMNLRKRKVPLFDKPVTLEPTLISVMKSLETTLSPLTETMVSRSSCAAPSFSQVTVGLPLASQDKLALLVLIPTVFTGSVVTPSVWVLLVCGVLFVGCWGLISGTNFLVIEYWDFVEREKVLSKADLAFKSRSDSICNQLV